MADGEGSRRLVERLKEGSRDSVHGTARRSSERDSQMGFGGRGSQGGEGENSGRIQGVFQANFRHALSRGRRGARTGDRPELASQRGGSGKRARTKGNRRDLDR